MYTDTMHTMHSLGIYTEFSSEVNKVLPSSLGHYSIFLVSKALLPRDSVLSGDKHTVYISQHRHSLIGTDSGDCSKPEMLLNTIITVLPCPQALANF